jgi:hypothetical protein
MMSCAHRWAAVLVLVVLGSGCACVYGQDDEVVAYQPDIIGVGRLFMVALKVPVGTPEIKLTVTESVVLLDRTPLPTDKELRKYYFRSLDKAGHADIVFGLAGGDVTVSFEIWSYDDLREFRELKGKQLPRRGPLGEVLPELKEGQTITSAATIAAAKEGNVYPKWLEMSDDEIWDMQPDSTIPRWHYASIHDGCPTHGTEIYDGKAWYPWRYGNGSRLRSYVPDLPYTWKIKCPLGGEIYPSNDFANGDFTSGEFPDDGIGGGLQHGGNTYGMVAELCQSYCHTMLRVAPRCVNSYMATGDMRYVHKALVAMSRVAVEFSYLATRTQHRHRNLATQLSRLGPAPFSEGPCLFRSGFTIYGD